MKIFSYLFNMNSYSDKKYMNISSLCIDFRKNYQKHRINSLIYLLMLIAFLCAAAIPENAVIAKDDKVNYTIEILSEEEAAKQESLPKVSHDASWYKKDAVYARLMGMKSQYPEGMTWTNDNYYRRTYLWYGGEYDGSYVTYTGYGCAGFTLIMSDAAFGEDLPIYQQFNVPFSKIRIGDELRINGDSHSVTVLEVHSNYVTIAEGNYNGTIHWGRTLTASEVENADYVLTRWPGVPTETYIISYNANGGSGAPAADYIQSGEEYFWLSDTRPVRNGYFFLGWSENANAVTPDYQPGDFFLPDENVTLYAVWGAPDLVIPASVTTIQDEAFSGGAFRFVKLSEKTKSIGRNAFTNCRNMLYIYIPDATTSIDPEAFDRTVTILCHYNSDAHYFAWNYDYSVIIVP